MATGPVHSGWKVVPQEVSVKGNVVQVWVRTIKKYKRSPEAQAAAAKRLGRPVGPWGKLYHPTRQVCIHMAGYPAPVVEAGGTCPYIRLRYTEGKSVWSVVYPDGVRPKTIEVGMKKKRRKVLDRLDPGTEVVKGERVSFANEKLFRDYCNQRFDKVITDKVVQLLLGE